MQPSAVVEPKIELLALLEERDRRKRENKLLSYQPYGSKSSVSSDEGSELDLIEMNYVHRESEREELETCIILAEDSTLLFTYNVETNQFETRNLVGLDVDETYPSFQALLEEPLEYTFY